MLQRLAPLVALLAFVLGASPVAAQATGVFTVSDVAVDVTGATASEARERAFAEGQRLALGRLLDRLGVDPSQLDPAGLSDAETARLIQGFQVDEESTSGGRYVATLTYDFRPEEVRRLLIGRAIGFAETASKPVVVVPVYRSDAGPRLWDSPNPWLEAWLDVSGDERLVPVIVPFGDLADVRDVSVEEALSGDRAALGAIAERYGAGGALVAVAEPRGDALAVTLNRYDAESGDAATALTVEPAADPSAQWAAAVAGSVAALEETWRARTRIQSGERSTLALLVPLNGSGDRWFAIQSRLRRVPTLVAARVVSLSPQEAVVELDYVGSEQQFHLALAQQDLAIDQGFHAPQLRLAGTRLP